MKSYKYCTGIAAGTPGRIAGQASNRRALAVSSVVELSLAGHIGPILQTSIRIERVASTEHVAQLADAERDDLLEGVARPGAPGQPYLIRVKPARTVTELRSCVQVTLDSVSCVTDSYDQYSLKPSSRPETALSSSPSSSSPTLC